ncbi:BMC domain-containing protein [Kalamiella sp. sgz302252]|uniref:BMC domain-containing protein n=1 Tax=Pantoea sp. sgz302252 TaxID=3341827 RepID=UPI0036D3AE82
MKSIGVIETRGLIAAIQATDAACKAAGVSCIGYRKPGSGRVSVCFEGEISAIHTAIERAASVINAEQLVSSLVIARPERSVVDALYNLKGYPPRPANEAVTLPPAGTEPAMPATLPAAAEESIPEDKNASKKGKKA